tara:strand:- start:5095 stop:6126 length:1032 start_codon:yes stop_codon:yes gene_type:complete
VKFGLLFAYQTPPESGIKWSEPYQDMIKCLPMAEKLGFSSALQASHHSQPDGFCPSPLIAMAGAAAVTEKMRIGTAVLLVPLYSPLKLAEDVAVLDNLSNGRFVLGVAPGYVTEEFVAHNIPREERVTRFEETLDILQLAWKGNIFKFSGKHFKIPEARVTPVPVQSPHPPIWYGVSAKSALKRAVHRRCVQIMSPRHGINELIEHYEPYDNEAKTINWKPPERPIIRQVFIAETTEKAENIASPAVDYLYRVLYGAASAAGDRVLRNDSGAVIHDTSDVAYRTFKERYIIGSPELAIKKIKQYQQALNPTEMICWMHMPGISGADVINSMRLFAKEVMPAFS